MLKNVICYGPRAYAIKDLIVRQVGEVRDNIKSFTPLKMFEELTIEICDPSSPDCPSEIKRFAGLTYPTLGRIQFNTTIFEYKDEPEEKYYANLVSHELGHWWAQWAGFHDEASEVKKLWRVLRGNKEEPVIDTRENIAEDFREFFGAAKAKGFIRGDHNPAHTVAGLKGLMQTMPAYNAFRKKELSEGRIPTIDKPFFSSSDPNYINLMVISRHSFFFWQTQHYSFDPNAFFKYDYAKKTWSEPQRYEAGFKF